MYYSNVYLVGNLRGTGTDVAVISIRFNVD